MWKGSLYAATVPFWFLPDLAQQGGGWRHATEALQVGREPGWSSCHYPRAGKHKQWCSLIHRSSVRDSSFSSQRTLAVCQHSLCNVSFVCCAEAVQLALSCLSRGSVLTVSVHAMCSWEGASSSHVAILDTPSPQFQS